jgi:hypothetical protein
MIIEVEMRTNGYHGNVRQVTVPNALIRRPIALLEETVRRGQIPTGDVIRLDGARYRVLENGFQRERGSP